MDSKQFDDLTRSLANGTSRRQALRLMGGSLAGGLLAMFGGVTEAAKRSSYQCCTISACGQPQPAPITPIASNVYTGSCDGLAQYRTFTGVRDDTGAYHPQYTGWTRVVFGYSPWTMDFNGRSSGKQVCLTATAVHVTFQATQATVRLDWQPESNFCTTNCVGEPSADCLAEIARWGFETEVHEGKHVQDNNFIVQQANTKWSKQQKITACDTTPAAAKTKLEATITALLDDEIRVMTDAAKTCGASFDSTHSIADPSCDTCINCAPPDIFPRRCETCSASLGICVSTCDSGCETCNDGTCVSNCPLSEYYPPPTGQVQLTCCSGKCVDLRFDCFNCGACGNICPGNTPGQNCSIACCNSICCPDYLHSICEVDPGKAPYCI